MRQRAPAREHSPVRQCALEDAIDAFVAATNEDPRPFVWTKSADEILDSVNRFCLRTSAAAQCQETSNSAQ